MQRLLNLPKSTDECDDCNDCEVQVECPKGKTPICSSPSKNIKTPSTCKVCRKPAEDCKCTKSCKVCNKPVSECKCTCRSRQRKARVDFSDVANADQPKPKLTGPTIGGRLKRSFSLCSLACRRLKTRFIPNSKCACGCVSKAGTATDSCGAGGNVVGGTGIDIVDSVGSGGGKCNAPKWLWTRLIRQSNGCKIYEVYKDSDGKVNPNSLDRQKGATIIFVVMPNGYIMPFESLNFH